MTSKLVFVTSLKRKEAFQSIFSGSNKQGIAIRNKLRFRVESPSSYITAMECKVIAAFPLKGQSNSHVSLYLWLHPPSRKVVLLRKVIPT